MLVKDKRVERDAKSERQTPLDMSKMMEDPNEDIIAAISKPLGSSASINPVTGDK